VTALDYPKAILLGVIQGLTEFLPVSSSGHLALSQKAMGLPAESDEMILFDVATHLGTLSAVVLVFAWTFRLFAQRLLAESRGSFTGRRLAWRFVALGVVASIPTAAIGLIFKDHFEALFGNLRGIGIGLLITGTLLYSTGLRQRQRIGWRRFGWLAAVIIGLAQGIAIWPGISRSGATICTAMLLGLRRRWAGEFSFFIAFPAICGAAALQFKDVLELPAEQLAQIPKGPILAGSLVALLSGYVALRFLLHVIRRAKLKHFCYYCWLVGAAVIIWGYNL
jgi:undecaprenyl-diphosphatase